MLKIALSVVLYSSFSYGYTAKWSQKSPFSQTFDSQVLNATDPDLDIHKIKEKCTGFDLNSVECAFQKNQSFYSKRNFFFLCPGYSVLYRVKSSYNPEHMDRSFSLGCAYFEDDKGHLIGVSQRSSIHKAPDDTSIPKEWQALKGQAICNPNVWSPSNDVNSPSGFNICMPLFFIPDPAFKATSDYTFSCEARFQCGLVSRRPSTDDPSKGLPRDFGNYCCTVQDFNSNFLIPQECTTSPVFPAGTSFDFKCAKDQAISEIVTKFSPQTADRSYQFKCCSLISGSMNGSSGASGSP